MSVTFGDEGRLGKQVQRFEYRNVEAIEPIVRLQSRASSPLEGSETAAVNGQVLRGDPATDTRHGFAVTRDVSGVTANASERSKTYAKTTLVVTLLGLASVAFLLTGGFAERISEAVSRYCNRRVPVTAPVVLGAVVCFATLVGSGITGSSIAIGLETFPIDGLAAQRLVGAPQTIRSDEYLVHTPLAIGQVSHVPRFPITNRNLGPDGQNMLLIGGSSVPVWHISALARPATWGYFVLDLPRALAWHWWFPIFGCFLAVWLFFRILFPAGWKLPLALSACLLASPYFAAWSFAPTSPIMFGATSFSAAYALLRKGDRGWHPFVAAVLGISVSAFALVLYPAWQVPLAYMFVLAFAAVMLRDRASLDITPRSISWIVAGLVLAFVILFAWWVDARMAITTVSATIYPGQRAASTGGDIEPWFWAKGLTNLVTMYSLPEGYSNKSEIASFVYFVLPAAFAVTWAMVSRRRLDMVSVALLCFLALAVAYQFVGFPRSLAVWSLWGRTLPGRVDIAVGVAALALAGSALAGNNCTAGNGHGRVERLAGLIISFVWMGCIAFSLYAAPAAIRDLLGSGVKIAVLCAAGVGSYLIAMGNARAFLVLVLAWGASSSIAFNPLVIVSQDSGRAGLAARTPCNPALGRALVIGSASNMGAMMMLASGCPVLNGVHFYPQSAIWRALDPEEQYAMVYNRYQHLIFLVRPLPDGRSVALDAPQVDMVKVTLDPVRFDFRVLPADYVIVQRGAAEAFRGNSSLDAPAEDNGEWIRLRVRRGG